MMKNQGKTRVRRFSGVVEVWLSRHDHPAAAMAMGA